MALDYQTYEEAQAKFNWSDRWQLFDGSKERFNIAHECIDRHPATEIALRLKFPDRHSEVYTFGELQRLTSQFANYLERQQIEFGARVAVLLHPSLQFYTSMFGAYKRGAVFIPLSPLFGPDALDFRLLDSQARAIVTTREYAKLFSLQVLDQVHPQFIYAEDLPHLLPRESDAYSPRTSAKDPSTIQYSSGTTGSPKPIRYTHDAITLAAVIIKLASGLEPTDVYFCPSSTAWGHGIWYGTIAPLVHGKAVGTLSGKFNAEVCLEALEEFGVTNMAAIASHFRLTVQADHGQHKLQLRILNYSGEAMPKQTIQKIMEQWGIKPYVQYGTTEAGPITADFGAFDNWVVKPGSLGKPMVGGAKVAILDEAGHEMPRGEPGQVAVWRKDHWLRVGDMASEDEDGYFWYLGRADDVIISSGYTIGPLEIEQTLNRHAAVEESAVVGSPDPDRGMIVKAYIKLRTGCEASEELRREIQDFVKGQLSRHEYPRAVEFIDDLPKTPEGKLKRKVLRQREANRVGIATP